MLDCLFPVRCILCQKEDFWICHKCLSSIKKFGDQICPVCQKLTTPDGKVCINCKRNNSLDGLLVATDYRDPLISKAIHFFKYRFIEDLHIPLANLIVKNLQSAEIPLPDLIIPIPLHAKRLRWRGFNQAVLLGKIVSEKLAEPYEIPMDVEILKRTRYTKPQMKIMRRSDRQKNILGAFRIYNSNAIKNKIILLIDDVSTTGFTIFECAKVLKKAGAKEVYAAVVAHEQG